jgi:hypothetical protein
MDYANQAFDMSQNAGINDLLVSDTKAWVMILSGQENQGIDLLLQFVDKATFPDAHYHIAVGYLKKKMPENAQAELRSARDILDRMPASTATMYAPLRAKVDAAGAEADKMAQDKTQAKATP